MLLVGFSSSCDQILNIDNFTCQYINGTVLSRRIPIREARRKGGKMYSKFRFISTTFTAS